MMLEINITLIGAILGVLISLITLAALLKRGLAAGTKENGDAISALIIRQDNFSTRLQNVENELSHLPSSKEFNELSTSVALMQNELKSINKTVEAIERSNRRMEDFLMKKGAS